MTDALSPDLSALLQQAQTGTAPAKSAASGSALSPDLASLLSQAQQPKSNSLPPGTLTGPLANFGAGANEMLADTLGAPADLVNWGLNKGIQGINKVAGTNIQQTTNPVGGSQAFKNALGIAGLNPDNVVAADPVDQIARGAGAGTMGMLVPGGAGAATGAGLAKLMGYGALGGATGQVAAMNVPDAYKPLAATAGNIIGGGVGALADAGLTAGANTIGKVARPFTANGRAQIANDLVTKFAGGTPNVVQPGEIVPGSVPTLAEVTNNANVSGLQRAVRDINPQPFVEREQANNDARRAFFGGAAGTPQDIEAATDARNQAALPKLNSALANAGPADPTAVNRAINRILASPAGQRDVVQNALTDIQGKLFVDNPLSDRIGRALGPINDALASGQLGAQRQADFMEARRLLNSAQRGYTPEDELTAGLKKLAAKQKIVGPIDNAADVIGEGDTRFQDDPAQLYGIRQAITDKLSPLSAGSGSDARLAARELGIVKTGIDGAIEKAAPGFRDYLDTFSTMSKPIDQMKFLQGMNLTDANGNFTLAKVQNALRNVQKLQGAKGLNPAKSLTPEQVGVLTSLRDDLLRASRVKSGTSFGSNTVQNAVNNFGMGRVGRVSVSALPTAAGAAAGAAIGHLFGYPELGGLAGGAAGELGGKALNAGAGAVRQELVSKLLNPSQAQPVAQAPFQRVFGVPVRDRPLNPAALRTGLVQLLAK